MMFLFYFCDLNPKRSPTTTLLFLISLFLCSAQQQKILVSAISTLSPDNDECTWATGTLVNAPEVVGSTAGSSADPWCRISGSTYKGVWYFVRGTGQVMTASTCSKNTNFDTVLSVQAKCNGACILNAPPTASIPTCDYRFGSYVTWSSKKNKLYYIHVMGQRSLEVGKFGFYVYDNVPLNAGSVPVNAQCNQATVVTVNGPLVYGNIRNTPFLTPWCGSAVQNDLYPGLWYKVRGTGNVMVASTCAPQTDYRSDIAIQTACNQDLDFCMDEANTGISIPCSNTNGNWFFWGSTVGHDYYIFVSGMTISDVGNFGLSVEDFQLASNADCPQALTIQPNSNVVVGSTITGGESIWCSDLDSSNPAFYVGVWYVVAGTGNLMSASTCNPETEYFSDLSVQTACGTAVTGCVEEPTLPTTLTCRQDTGVVFIWESILNQPYYIFVSGQRVVDTGTYGFSVSDHPVPLNSDCANAFPLERNGLMVVGSTFGAVESSYCAGSSWYGVWYRVQGTGRRMLVSTCHDETSFPSELYVHAFQCSSNCNGVRYSTCPKNNFGAVASFTTSTNQFYYVFVTGRGNRDAGVFGIDVQDAIPDRQRISDCASIIANSCPCSNLRTACANTRIRNVCSLSLDKNVFRTEQRQAFKKGQRALQQTKCRKTGVKQMRKKSRRRQFRRKGL